MRGRIIRRAILVIASAAALFALPAPAAAVLSGFNGRILFTSGRGEADDSTARLFLRTILSSTGGGTAGPTITPSPPAPAGVQHRHATWSPDRTMIAYSRGPNSTVQNFDIFILDLTDPNATPQNITNSDNVTDDRPAWSPDGTRIAFDSENADGSNQLNIKIYDVGSGNTTNFTDPAAGTYETKPAWTPDSQTLYYTVGNPSVAGAMQIVTQPAAGGTVSPITVAGGLAEFQPSISPDGTRMCYTRGDQFGSSNSRVIVALANGGGSTELPGTMGVASYNCTWSPDGRFIAYVQGIFANGALVMEDSDPTPPLQLIGLEDTTGRFDGNPDWAPDGRPTCENTTVSTTIGTPVSIPLRCTDTGPAYERTSLIVDVPTDARPANGTVGEVQQGDPATVTYSPNGGFLGTDSFEIRVRDELAFGGRATVTINVTRFARTINFDASKAKGKQAGKDSRLAVRKGRKARLSGEVSAPQNAAACEANQTLELQRKKPKATSFTTIRQVQTDGAGSFSLKKKVKKTFEYRVVLGESQTCEDATSNSEKVKAKKKRKK